MKTDIQPDMDTLVLPAEMKWDDEGWCDVSCPALPVYTCARSEAEAKEMLIDAVECFCDACREIGTFDAILKKVGYNGNNPLPIIKLDLNGELLEARHLRSFEPDEPEMGHEPRRQRGCFQLEGDSRAFSLATAGPAVAQTPFGVAWRG